MHAVALALALRMSGPVPTPTPTPDSGSVVMEDEPGWDCRTMGNRVCGSTGTGPASFWCGVRFVSVVRLPIHNPATNVPAMTNSHITIGATYRNGFGIYTHGANWGEAITVIAPATSRPNGWFTVRTVAGYVSFAHN